MVTTKKTTRKEAAKAKRRQLVEMSKMAKMAIREGATDCTSVNEYLIEMYTDAENKVFNTFNQWKEKGKKIIKGSTAFLVWGRKRKTVVEKDGEETEYKFFPVAYLFSNAQVE